MLKKLLYCILLLLIRLDNVIAHTQQENDTLTVYSRKLFELSACQCDVQIPDERPIPTITVVHDSLLLYSAYKDTLLLITMKGEIVSRIYHTLGYASYLHYNNQDDKLYFLNTGVDNEIKAKYIYVFNHNLLLQDSVKFTGQQEEWLTLSGLLKADEVSRLKEWIQKQLQKKGSMSKANTQQVLRDIRQIYNYDMITFSSRSFERETLISNLYFLSDHYKSKKYINRHELETKLSNEYKECQPRIYYMSHIRKFYGESSTSYSKGTKVCSVLVSQEGCCFFEDYEYLTPGN